MPRLKSQGILLPAADWPNETWAMGGGIAWKAAYGT